MGSSLFHVEPECDYGYGMMPAYDTGRDVWTVTGAWEGLACRGSSVFGKLLDVRVKGPRDRRVVV